MTRPAKQPVVVPEIPPEADLLTVVITGEGRIGLVHGASNTISPYAWPTILRKAAALLEATLE